MASGEVDQTDRKYFRKTFHFLSAKQANSYDTIKKGNRIVINADWSCKPKSDLTSQQKTKRTYGSIRIPVT